MKETAIDLAGAPPRFQKNVRGRILQTRTKSGKASQTPRTELLLAIKCGSVVWSCGEVFDPIESLNGKNHCDLVPDVTLTALAVVVRRYR